MRKAWPALLILGVLAGCSAPAGPQTGSAPAAARLFSDRASESGIDFVHFNGMSGELYVVEIFGPGGALFDYDNDGDLDLYLVQGAMLGDRDPERAVPAPQTVPLVDRLYRNELVESGRMFFTDVTASAGFESTGYGMGVAAGDYDGDGWTDLYVTNFGSNLLLHNNGDGTFSDHTVSSGTDDPRWSTSAAFLDYDADGLLDLYVVNYIDFTFDSHKNCYSGTSAPDYCGPLSYQPYPDRLLRNVGGGRFEDVSAASGIGKHSGSGLGVVCADFNGDGRIDIYLANDGLPNHLWINLGHGAFENRAVLAGVAYNEDGLAEAGMGVDAADFDGDGDEDLFLTHLKDETNTLYANDGNGWFQDVTRRARLGSPSREYTGFGTAWFDYDNDSWLDLLVNNGGVKINAALRDAGDPFPLRQPNQLYRNLGNSNFEELDSALEHVEVGRGAAFGDVDNDGDSDVVLCNNSGPTRLLINNVGNRKSWLGLRLFDAEGRTPVLGARVEIELPDGRSLWRRVRTAASYLSSNDGRLLVGLGDVASIETLRVHWPDGTVERYAVPGIRRYIDVRRGAGTVEP